MTCLIVASFVLQDRYSSLIPQQKYFAKVDGHPINPKKLFQMLDYQVKRIKESAPHLTSEDFKMARFPEQMLDEYIRKVIKGIELSRQGFSISEPMLIKKLNMYGPEFMQNFRYIDPIKKKTILDDVRKDLVEQQLFLPYQLPRLYQMALYKSFYSKRHFDLVSIDYDKIVANEMPTEADLKTIVSKNAQEFMEDEKRSFYLIDLNQKKIAITEQELQHYYDKHKKLFISPTTKKLLSFKEAKHDVVNHVHHEKLAAFAKALREKIENDELEIGDIEGCPQETFSNITKETAFKYSLNVLNYAFDQDLNVLSDPYEDPVSGHLFVVQPFDIQAESQMTGDSLKKAATILWLREKKEIIAKQDLETLFSLEDKPAEFYAFIKSKHFTLKSNMHADRTQNNIDGVDPELLHRIFSVGQGKVVYNYAPHGIIMARVTNDALHTMKDFDAHKTSGYFLKAAFQSVSTLFLIDVAKHHKVEKDIKQLYEECQF